MINNPQQSSAGGAGQGRTARYAAPALDKGLDILESLADAPTGLTLKQLSETLGRRPAELFRMVVRLHERGYLKRTEDDAYHLTAKLLSVAHRHAPTKRLVDAALPVMHRLADQVSQSCHLAQLHPPDLVVVAEVIGLGPLSLTVRAGSHHDPRQTASGRLLLAWCDPDPGDGLSGAERRRLVSEGFARQPSQALRGVVDLAAAVFDHTDRPVAALTIPVLVRRDADDAPEETVEALRSAARQLSETLGGALEPSLRS